ncbi:MAG: tol-pal system protein YbgF [Xanthomonadales bacterium]|nr:tol-pal system protein YbgF [Xanthomonadales bacterium]
MVRHAGIKASMAGIALAITFSAPVIAQSADPATVANLVVQVQELQDEVRSLRGQLEEQQRELENMKRRQRDQYLDLDQRLSDLRNAQPVMPSGTAAAAAPRPGPTMPPAEDVPEVRAPIESQSQATGIGQPVVESAAAPAAAAAEKAAYDQAFQALKELRYADAAEEFQSFLDRYPNSEFSDNAQYWLGESYYVTRNYDIALRAFQDLLSQFPESPKAPDALLKVGYTHYELEQWDSARAALTQVQEQYPDSTLSRLAENRLRSMRMEGHY